jgi:type VI secretion system secreted protein Hcp
MQRPQSPSAATSEGEQPGECPVKEIGYIKLEGIDGSATDSAHKNWSKIFSMSQDVTRPPGGNAGAARNDRATLNDIVVTKEFDKSSPQLFQYSCDGKVIPKVEIHLTTSTGAGKEETYAAYTLEKVRVSNYHSSAAASGDATASTDVIALNFQKTKLEYTSIGQDGSAGGKAQGSWNVETNQAN